MKALATITKSVSINYQAMIRDKTSARGACDVLENFFNRELVTTLAAADDPLDDRKQLIILLGSLPREYHATVKIIKNIAEVTMLQAAEMRKREYAEGRNEVIEVPFNLPQQRNKSAKSQFKIAG
ncbi:hypothetical protein CCR75_002340 [Bremia lactucae]|uniref:Polyprotein n=1 Tax=Bremia lactucae TaxID=4779 RepID=A0A976IFS1_BRELC|nr:hypothetical protein CCR75_002340 [Bremia lactucae]